MFNIPQVELNCICCGKSFKRSKYEHNRSQKLGRKTFCSLSCSCKFNNKREWNKGKPEFLVGHCDNKRDKYTPFRWFLKVINNKNRTRKKEVGINLEYLKKIWEDQKGICPYTGWELVLPYSTMGFKSKENKIYRASLDRIDCSKGYIKGNVQFVSFMANIAKGDMANNDMFKFCEAVVSNNK